MYPSHAKLTTILSRAESWASSLYIPIIYMLLQIWWNSGTHSYDFALVIVTFTMLNGFLFIVRKYSCSDLGSSPSHLLSLIAVGCTWYTSSLDFMSLSKFSSLS